MGRALQPVGTFVTPSARPSKHPFLRSVFSLRLETVPSKICDHPELTRLPQPPVKETSATHQAIQAAWRTQVLATLHTIWRWRSEPDTPETLWTPVQARAYHDGCMRATLMDLCWRRTQDSAASCHTAAAIEIIRSWDPDRELEPATGADASAPIYVMFFDVGSRGNLDQAAAERSSSARTTTPSRQPSSGQQQRHWPMLLKESWNRYRLWDGSEAQKAFKAAIFDFRPPHFPAELWRLPELARIPKQDTEGTNAVHQAAQVASQQQVLDTLLVIWRWRHNIVEGTQQWSQERATLYLHGVLRSTLRGLDRRLPAKKHLRDPRTQLLEELGSALTTVEMETKDPVPSFSAPRHILFFDGGSRGNPGPGGAGAVIVETDDDAINARVVWSACMSYAQHDMTNNKAEYLGLIAGLQAAKDNQWQVEVVGDSSLILRQTSPSSWSLAHASTTNNQAEYVGALEGLRAAHKHQWLPLEVVGDSQLILRQLMKYNEPRNGRLAVLYAEARRLADRLGIHKWHHHQRAFNKMADAAANAAMDSRASSQVLHPTTRVQHAELARHLGSDFAHWQAHYIARLLVQ